MLANTRFGLCLQVVEASYNLVFWTATELPKGIDARQPMNKLLAWLQPLLVTADSLSSSQIAGFKQWLHSECLPALAVAAAVMQRHLEQRPWIQQAEVLLESGLAAASRSCAYLRCANLGGEGGPAAGQGHGSAMCRCGLECHCISRATLGSCMQALRVVGCLRCGLGRQDCAINCWPQTCVLFVPRLSQPLQHLPRSLVLQQRLL